MKMLPISQVNKDVKIIGESLFFGDKEVLNPEFIKGDSIALLYVIRVKEGDFLTFVTGLDLIDNKFWLGGSSINMWVNQKQKVLPSAFYDSFQSVQYVLDHLYTDTAGKEWFICEEEDFSK